MSFLNEYNSDLTGIVFEDPLDKIINDAFDKAVGGGTTTTTKAKEPERWLESYSSTELRYAYRAGQITEDEWIAELVDRKNTPQQAKAEVERQKSTGLSTAASTKGQLTASEQNAVNAMKSAGAPAGRPEPLSGVGGLMERRDAASKPFANMGPESLKSGAAPASAPSPAPASAPAPSAAPGGQASAPAAKSTSGGSTSSGGGSTASGGSRVATTGKLDDPGAQFAVRGPNGVTYNWREFTRADGSTYYKNLQTGDVSDLLPTAAAEKPVVKKSPGLQQAEQAGKIFTALGGGNPDSFDDAPADAGPQGLTPKPAAQFAYGPSAAGQKPHASGVDVATDDKGGRMMIPSSGLGLGTGILGANKLRSTGDPEQDLVTALAVIAKRDTFLAQNPGMTPTEYSQMMDAQAAAQANPLGGRPNFNTGYVQPVSTGAITAGGKLALDDSSADERAFLNPEDYMAKGTPDFNTPNPIAFVDMVTGKPIGMAGGTGRETISVDPDGPHGTPAQEAQVGSRLWPGKLGLKPHANGLDDLMRDFGGNPDAQSDGPYVDYSSMNGGRDPDYISKSMLSSEPGPVSFPSGASQRGLSLDEIHKERKARGWGASTFEDPVETNDEWTRYAWSHPGDPLLKLPASMLPSWAKLDPATQRLRDIARRPWYYGYNDSYQPMAEGGEISFDTPPEWYASRAQGPFNPNAVLDTSLFTDRRGMPPPYSRENPPHNPMTPGFYAGGGSGFAGHPGEADNGGMSDLSKVFQLQDLDNAGVFDLARLGWESGFMTPNMQARLWATQSLPGNGNPIGGNHFLPGLTYPGMSGYGGNVPLASLYNTNAAQLTTDTYRELGNQVNPNATRSLGLEAPMTQAQIMRTPIKTLMTQGANANQGTPPQAVTMADGGMGMAGDPMMMQEPQTQFSMLLETLLAPKGKGGRKPPLRPVGATMGVAA